MLSLFRPKRQKPPPPTVSVAEGYQPIESAHSLLAAEHRRQLLDRIWQYTALSHAQFTQFYLNPIHRYAEQVQQLPASETHHHAYLGGMLDHGLELVACSLKLRQSYLLPTGAAPEDQAAQTDDEAHLTRQVVVGLPRHPEQLGVLEVERRPDEAQDDRVVGLRRPVPERPGDRAPARHRLLLQFQAGEADLLHRRGGMREVRAGVGHGGTLLP